AGDPRVLLRVDREHGGFLFGELGEVRGLRAVEGDGGLQLRGRAAAEDVPDLTASEAETDGACRAGGLSAKVGERRVVIRELVGDRSFPERGVVRRRIDELLR